MGEVLNILLLQNALRTATPVVLAALGCLMTQHVNITNIGIEGMMLTGAFFAVLGSYFAGSWVAGVACALLVGLLLGLFYYVFVIKFKSDEFIIGVALNIFAGGLTVFLLRNIFDVKVFRPRDRAPAHDRDSADQGYPRDRPPAQRQHAAGLCQLDAGARVLGVYLQDAHGLPPAGVGRIPRRADRCGQEPRTHEVPG